MALLKNTFPPCPGKTGYFTVVLTITFLVLLNCKTSSSNQQFSTHYYEEALLETELPDVIKSHPRLLIRSEPWQHGPSLSDLKEWTQLEPLKSYLNRKQWGPKPDLKWAFRYLLTGDEKLVVPVVQNMKKKSGYWPGSLTELATLYDWLYNSPNFTDEDKRVVEEKMIQGAEKAIKMGEEYADMWSHFGYRPPLDIAAAGLALYGHREEAKNYIAMAGGYIKKNMFPGWRLNEGGWQGGWAYYGQGCHNLFQFIALWSSATNEDLFEFIEKEQGDWVRNHLYYLIYTIYPDHTPVDSTGFNWASQDGNDQGATKSLLMLTRAYRDLQGAMNLNWRDPWGWRLGIFQFLYSLPEFMKPPGESYDLPLTKCWGRNGLGYVQMRSGWGDDDTIIEFKCGDYFWSHQFHNQNSFTIYHKGRLAIQSGAYGGRYFGPHVVHYYRPTVSSNTILVIQPGEKTWIPPKAAKRHGTEVENGYCSEFGGQRSCYVLPKYGSAENCFTFEKYLYRKDHQHHFETGNIKAFEVTDQYSYVYGDATMAYNNPAFSYPGNKPKIDLFTRQLVFLDKKYLVIFDRVNVLDAEYEKRWLLHSIGEPQFREKPSKVEYPVHREVYQSGLVRIDNRDGTLFCQTLFPDDYLIRKVGGSATVTEAKADSSNQGNALFTTAIQGKYKRVSATIATDKAAKEDWVIEGIDSDHFRIKGSVTGEDGTGSYSSRKDDVFISNSQSIFIPKENWKGIPEKGDKFYFSVTSLSHRFWVDDKNVFPSPESLINIIRVGSQVEPGNWRIEVFPREKQKFDTFLHLLYPCDRYTVSPPATEGIMTSDKVMQGINIEDWIVFFGHKGTVDQKTEYSIKTEGEVKNLLLDMKPEQSYLITIISASNSINKQKVTASKEGTISFTAPGNCRVEIIPF